MKAILHHMAEHTWAWAAGSAVLGVAAAFLRLDTPAALLFMLVGLLVMMRNEGTSLEKIVAEDAADDWEAPEPTPQPSAERGQA
jgi:hypothetical protein